MTESEERWQEVRERWEQVGKVAEQFARRVAKDAGDFAGRVEKHVGQLAHELEREWQREEVAADVRRVVRDVGSVLGAVVERVDAFVSDLFTPPTGSQWTRATVDRDVTCQGCRRPVAAGTEAWVRSRGAARLIRCAKCGPPAA
ncbi:MAG TPA: hypothetical protein VKA21_07470 [Candidatus Binatia bacterium]|nr:hypothetical protein [Candidatus Binatia bacterium]